MFTAFILAFLLNMYIVIFGKKRIKKLFEEKVSIKKYIDEILKSSEDLICKSNLLLIKLILAFFMGLLLIVEFVFVSKLIIAFLMGTYAAKRFYQVPAISNVLNKISTYIVRFFK